MELHENAKQNVLIETIHQMAVREIEYKTKIDRQIRGIKIRQIISIIFSIIIIGIISVILWIGYQNFDHMRLLIGTLIEGFKEINTMP